MNIKRILIAAAKMLAVLLPAVVLTSCLGDDSDPYKDWRQLNNKFVQEKEASIVDGKLEYNRISPSWQPGSYVLMKWHNDRALTEKNLVPLYNSTVDMKYELELLDGIQIENSYSTATGDSTFQTTAAEVVVGWQIALMQMHVGDSVTLIVPWQYGYGSSPAGDIPAFSTLIFHMKLKGIPYYQREEE